MASSKKFSALSQKFISKDFEKAIENLVKAEKRFQATLEF